MAMTTTNPDYQRSPMFDEVWAILQNVAKKQEEAELRLQKEAELRKEEDERREEEFFRRKEEFAQQVQENTRRMNRMDKQIGGLHNKFGKLAEHLVAPGITKRFNELGYHFGSVSPGGHRIFDEKGNTKADIDLLLENGETIMAVEVKVTPAIKDIDHHIKRLEILRDHRRSINDRRKVLGAIAGAMFGIEEQKATADAGLYIIEQSGDTMRINIPAGFVPRAW